LLGFTNLISPKTYEKLLKTIHKIDLSYKVERFY